MRRGQWPVVSEVEMGSRGPAPEPTRVREIKGNPGKRRMQTGEPRPSGERMPSAPRWMSLEAKREWRKIAPRLFACGLLTEVDGLGLAMLCESFAQYVEAKRLVEEAGMVATSDNGNVYQHPAVGVMKSARGELLKWLREFGMTPSARSRISLEAATGEESLADILFGGVG